MKQKDVAIIIAAAIVAGILSIVVGRLLFATPKARHQKVEVVEAISTEFPAPDSKYFNSSSINPTQLIQIGTGSNSTPFNGTSQ